MSSNHGRSSAIVALFALAFASRAVCRRRRSPASPTRAWRPARLAEALGSEVRALLAAQAGRFWMGYACRPAKGKHRSCCWSSGDDGDCGGCRLEGDKGEGSFRTSRPRTGDASSRTPACACSSAVKAGGSTRVRTVSEDCGLDAGGLPFVWIDGRAPGRQRGLPRGPSRRGRRAGQGPLGRRARGHRLHRRPRGGRGPRPVRGPGQPEHRRKQAAFWMGQARGATGLRDL